MPKDGSELEINLWILDIAREYPGNGVVFTSVSLCSSSQTVTVHQVRLQGTVWTSQPAN